MDNNGNEQWDDGTDAKVWGWATYTGANSVNVQSGLFSLVLADEDASEGGENISDCLGYPSLYLHVEIYDEDGSTWLPLGDERLWSVPYALVGAGGGSATPADGNGSVQFNDGGSFGGDANTFFWDNTNKRLGLGTSHPAEKLDVEGNININYNYLKNTILFPSGYGNRSANLTLPCFSDLIYYAVERGLFVTTNRGPDIGSLANMFNLNLHSNALWNNVNTTPVTITIDIPGTAYIKHLGMFFGYRNSQAVDYTIEIFHDHDNNGLYEWETVDSETGNAKQVKVHLVNKWRVDSVRINITDAGDGDMAGVLRIATIQITSPLHGKATGHLLDIGGDTMYGDLDMNSNRINDVATPRSTGTAIGSAVSTSYLNGKEKATSSTFHLYER